MKVQAKVIFFQKKVLNMICIMQQNGRVENNVERNAT
jgi:hypothetical protein